MNEKNSALSVINVEKLYGREGSQFQALSNINFEIEKGEFTDIMEPSGAGKSTLLNLIATTDKPSAGQVIMDGRDVTAMSETELADFRCNNLLPNLTAEENISLPLVLTKEKSPIRLQKVLAISAALGISGTLEQYPSTLSGGQKQRVAAARAMVTSPALLLLADEPTGALDSKSGRDLLESLWELNQKRTSA